MTATIFDFANNAYDAGIKDRVLIASQPLDNESRQMAEKLRIKIVEESKLESFLTIRPHKPRATVFRFDNKRALMDSLVNLGYTIEENTKISGRTGVEYTFDLLAYASSDRIA